MKTYAELSKEQLIEILHHKNKILKDVKYGLVWDKEKQKEEYTCKECGGVISIHQKFCSECNAKT